MRSVINIAFVGLLLLVVPSTQERYPIVTVKNAIMASDRFFSSAVLEDSSSYFTASDGDL